MIDKKKILEIAQQSKLEKWPYPKIFDALKAAGVESYEVDVAHQFIVYKGKNQEFSEKSEKTAILPISNTFDVKAVQAAIRNNQMKKTTYDEFLKGIGEAGVVKYLVVMENRCIYYQGAHQEDEHVETIPH